MFVSRPSVLTPAQEAAWRLVKEAVEAAGADVVTIEPNDYPPAGVLADVRRTMADCSAVVVLGFRQLQISAGRWRPGTGDERSTDGMAMATPWNQVEAGMAAALGLPIFVVREPGVAGGVFDVAGDMITVIADLDDVLARRNASDPLQRWVSEFVS